MNKTIGVILCIIGVIGLLWGGIRYTTEEKVLDVGPIHATREQHHDVPLPPIVGALVLLGGVALLISGKKE